MKNILNFFDNKNIKLFLFSEIKIILFDLFFIMFKEKILDNVSTVFPDFEIIIKSTFDKFSFFLRFLTLFSSRSFKKYIFFLFFLEKNYI